MDCSDWLPAAHRGKRRKGLHNHSKAVPFEWKDWPGIMERPRGNCDWKGNRICRPPLAWRILVCPRGFFLPVPFFLFFTSSSTPHLPFLSFRENQSHLTAGTYVKLNPGQVGFYRVKYSESHLAALMEIAPTLSFVDRLGLLSDSKRRSFQQQFLHLVQIQNKNDK